MNKNIKIALSCAVILLFIGGSIAAAEQTKFETLGQTKPIKPGEIMTTNGRIINESDIQKAVIKSGTIMLPNTNNEIERMSVTKEAMRNLWKNLNVPKNETLTMDCNAAGKCTYRVAKFVKPTTSSSANTNLWLETATGNVSQPLSYYGYWTVPAAPTNNEGQVMFYFTALEDSESYPYILQPVLQWNNAGSNRWQIASWYGSDSAGYYESNPVNVNVGDSIYGNIYQNGGIGDWGIYIADTTQSTSTSAMTTNAHTFSNSYVTLEKAGPFNTCNDLPGTGYFTNLAMNGATLPQWQPVYPGGQVCGISVSSSSDKTRVTLNTGR